MRSTSLLPRLALLTALLTAGAASAASVAPAAETATLTPAPATVWVSPRQTIALLSQPAVGALAGPTVASGDALTVLSQQGEFLQVRTEAGASGWIRRRDLSDSAPAPSADQVEENARLQEQVRTLDAQLQAFQAENQQLRERMQAADAELAARTRPVPLTVAGVWAYAQRLAAEPSAWTALAVLLLMLLAAFRYGIEHRNRSIRDRLGGLDL